MDEPKRKQYQLELTQAEFKFLRSLLSMGRDYAKEYDDWSNKDEERYVFLLRQLEGK